VGAQAEREGGVRQQREEAEVVERRDQAAAARGAVAQGAQWVEHGDALARRRGRGAIEEDRGGHEADGHQDGDAEERPAPADPAEEAPEQRSARDAEPERRLVEHHGARDAAGG
jgi:hypothetical protein